MNLEEFAFNPATLALIVFGSVEFLKQLGMKGNGLRWASLACGILLAAGYKIPQMVPAAQPWLEMAFFGLAAGLTASGVYGYLSERLPRLG